MPFRRTAVCLAVALLIAVPAFGPCAVDLIEFGFLTSAHDAGRWIALAGNTVALIAGVWLVALPTGTALALLLGRSDLVGRAWLRDGFVVALFVPLPVIATAWQGTLGGGSWATGLPAAIWVHAVAGLPWVVWIVALSVGAIEPEVEDDARTVATPAAVLWRVTLPRIVPSVGAAALWLALGCATEITVTDLMQVRTFAEEVYTQTVLPDPGAPAETMPARAVAVALPPMFFTAILVAATVAVWQKRLPPLGSSSQSRPLVRLGSGQAVTFCVVALTLAALIAVPIGTLVWRLGRTGRPETWSAAAAGEFLRLAAVAHWPTIGRTALAGVGAGALAALLALLACWQSYRDRRFGAALVVVMASLWAMPGPVVGVALMQSIGWLLDAEDRLGTHLFAANLYDGPSALPAAWACLIRFFPCAVALVWPSVRAIPTAQFDAAAIDGVGELRHVVWPHAAAATLRAAGAVGILTFGEIGASKIVATPGGELFAHDVFARMHYGPGNQLAALCLLLLAVVLPPAGLLAFIRRRR